jgi:hypothetical protein
MPTPDQMRAAAANLHEQWNQLEEAKTALKVQAAALGEERTAINWRQNDLLQAAITLEYQAGEEERGGNRGTPNEAVSALIEAAISAAESAPTTAAVEADGQQAAEVQA